MKTRSLVAAGLLLLAVAGSFLLIRRHSVFMPPASGHQSAGLETAIKSTAVQKTGAHARVSLALTATQTGHTPLLLEPPLVRLLTSTGKTAPRYLGPMLPEPILSGPGPAEITLHYWLPLTDLNTPLTLEAAGKRHPVHLPAGFQAPAPEP